MCSHGGKMVKGPMTNVEISYNYGMSPDEAVMRGIDNIREVYGIRRLKVDDQAHRVAVEYDATRLNPATIASLLRRAGLDLQ
jgi:copper chaperone CopZ